MRFLITGGTGFIGGHIACEMLQQGHEVAVTTRSGTSPLVGQERYRTVTCDTTRPGPWQAEVARCDVIINLAGRSIFTRWNSARKMEMEESRLLTTEHVVGAIPEDDPPLLLNASAVGFYGDRGDILLGEEEAGGDGFLADLCQRWEAIATKAEAKGSRVVFMRFGAVLGKDGGALATMLPAYKLCLGGPLGNGQQWFPWIHIDDLVRAVLFLISDETIQGPVNFTAPFLARHMEFSDTLGQVLGRPAPFAVPSFALKMIFGELGGELLFSQRVVPQVLSRHGFQFTYPSVESALGHLIHSPGA